VGHLLSFRRGWENENLARFILSKFSFVAHPSSVADDIGSDFYCTIFETEESNGHSYIKPRNSFAIQIKSNHKPINVLPGMDYLANLEIPFLVGVVDQKEMKLTIYSGMYIPIFIATFGTKKK
jgi:hypothetical protein